MNLAIPKEGLWRSNFIMKQHPAAGPCRTKSSVFLIKTLSRILMSLLGSSREPDFFIPLMTFKNKYYANLTFKCFLFYLFIKHFLIVALCQKKFIPVNLLIFQPTLLLGTNPFIKNLEIFQATLLFGQDSY